MARRLWSRSKLLVAAILLLAAVLAPLPHVQACPNCIPQVTLTEQLASADSAVLVQWVGGQQDTEAKPGTTLYQIQQIVKGPKSLTKNQKITLKRYRTSKPGDLFLLLGTDLGGGQGLEWGSPLEVSETSFNYLTKAPSPEAPPSKRLPYFLKFLEFPDPIISNDAYGEFANAEYQHIEQLASQLPRDKIRKWLANPDTPPMRLGLYGMLIGLCGDESDAKTLEARILVQTDEYRFGIEGLMSGYLLLLKDKGLDVLDQHKLANNKIPFSETYAAMQALRFLWTYSPGTIAPERLRKSMRILLDRTEMTDIVIADLSRWKDWSLQDKLMQKYGTGEFNTPSIKRAIVRYMLVSSQDVATGGGAPQPPHVSKGQKLLEELRTRDPKSVSEAERFFVVP